MAAGLRGCAAATRHGVTSAPLPCRPPCQRMPSRTGVPPVLAARTVLKQPPKDANRLLQIRRPNRIQKRTSRTVLRGARLPKRARPGGQLGRARPRGRRRLEPRGDRSARRGDRGRRHADAGGLGRLRSLRGAERHDAAQGGAEVVRDRRGSPDRAGVVAAVASSPGEAAAAHPGAVG